MWFHTDDDSKYLDETRHALIFTWRSSSGEPEFRLGTTSAAAAATAEYNSKLNVESLLKVLGDDAGGLEALFHYGGCTTDNASDAFRSGW
jgi:hypothetical protein